MYIVTGCAGFIGSHVARRLLESGEEVLGIDEVNSTTDTRLKRWRLEALRTHSGFKILTADITSRDTVTGVTKLVSDSGIRPAALLNLAGRAGVQPSVKDPQLFLDTNLTGTLNMMDLCHELRISKFVSASSSSVYGNSSIGPVSEDNPTDSPLSPYAASKKAAEVLAHSYHHLHGLDISMLRFFTVYGPAGRPDMSVLRFIRWIAHGEPVIVYGDGSQERDFTYVDDVARGVLTALKPVGYEAINLGSNSPAAINELIAIIESAVGREAIVEQQPPSRAEVRSTWANISKAHRVLNWEPRVSLERGIQETVAWYLMNRELVDSLDPGLQTSVQKKLQRQIRPESPGKAAA